MKNASTTGSNQPLFPNHPTPLGAWLGSTVVHEGVQASFPQFEATSFFDVFNCDEAKCNCPKKPCGCGCMYKILTGGNDSDAIYYLAATEFGLHPTFVYATIGMHDHLKPQEDKRAFAIRLWAAIAPSTNTQDVARDFENGDRSEADLMRLLAKHAPKLPVGKAVASIADVTDLEADLRGVLATRLGSRSGTAAQVESLKQLAAATSAGHAPATVLDPSQWETEFV